MVEAFHKVVVADAIVRRGPSFSGGFSTLNRGLVLDRGASTLSKLLFIFEFVVGLRTKRPIDDLDGLSPFLRFEIDVEFAGSVIGIETQEIAPLVNGVYLIFMMISFVNITNALNFSVNSDEFMEGAMGITCEYLLVLARTKTQPFTALLLIERLRNALRVLRSSFNPLKI